MNRNELSVFDRLVAPPFFTLDNFDFNQALDTFFLPVARKTQFNPRAELEEQDTHYILSLDVPGVKAKDLKVEERDGVLTVSGERKVEHKDKKRGFSECSYGTFTRSFALPQDAESNQIDASYENGVLRLVMAKKKVAPQKMIEIKTGKTPLLEKLLHRENHAEEKEAETVKT